MLNLHRGSLILLQVHVILLGGSLQKVSSYIFVLGPANVDITGDLQNILGICSVCKSRILIYYGKR